MYSYWVKNTVTNKPPQGFMVEVHIKIRNDATTMYISSLKVLKTKINHNIKVQIYNHIWKKLYYIIIM